MNEDSYLVDFEVILERINNLEEVVVKLLNPELMYRPPGSETHENITDTLDYLHKKVKELEDRHGNKDLH
jgi:hypothetical protein